MLVLHNPYHGDHRLKYDHPTLVNCEKEMPVPSFFELSKNKQKMHQLNTSLSNIYLVSRIKVRSHWNFPWMFAVSENYIVFINIDAYFVITFAQGERTLTKVWFYCNKFHQSASPMSILQLNWHNYCIIILP